jgi:hypothetical protein
MNASLSGRHTKDQPSFAGVNGWEFENVSKEVPVRFRVSAVKQQMGAKDHRAEYTSTTSLHSSQPQAPRSASHFRRRILRQTPQTAKTQ